MAKKQDVRYEELYNRLLERGMAMHTNNKRRIRIGLGFLGLFTVLMILIRWITDSDRVIFMLFWILGMFATAIYLVSVEYIDDRLQRTLEEVSDRESDFDDLMLNSEQVHKMVHYLIREHQDIIREHYIEHWRGGSSESGGES